MKREGIHRDVAESCWRMIKALAVVIDADEEAEQCAINLIEMACDSAAEALSRVAAQPRIYRELKQMIAAHGPERVRAAISEIEKEL
jgi:hypothetical protein